MTLLELATQISQSLNSPDSPTVGVIMYKLRHSIGDLNNLINTSYTINATDGTVVPELDYQTASILQSIYMIYYWTNHINSSIGAGGYDHILEVSEGGATVRKTNRSELAKTFSQVRSQEQMNLDNLVNFYRSNNAIPQSIDGTDTIEELYGNTTVRDTD